MRIDFQFDKAAFDFRFLPFKIPYPVPFKYLGDETKVCSLILPAGIAKHGRNPGARFDHVQRPMMDEVSRCRAG